MNQTASKEEPNNLNVFNKQTNNSSGQFSLLSAFGGQSKETNSSAGQFSLLSEFGQSKETESNVPEETETEILSDAFALKLKEKAANEASAKGLIEPFFSLLKLMEHLLRLINFYNLKNVKWNPNKEWREMTRISFYYEEKIEKQG